MNRYQKFTRFRVYPEWDIKSKPARGLAPVPDLKSVIRENDHPQTQGTPFQRHGPFTQWTTDSSQDSPSYVLKDTQRPSSLMQPEIPSSKQLLLLLLLLSHFSCVRLCVTP